MGKLYVTIDTEMDADIYWKKGNPVCFSSVLEGIPKLYRPIWDRNDVNPIYFVSPEIVENDDCCEILRGEIEKGAIIGAHLHPEYIEPERVPINEIETEKFPCFGYEYEIEKEKIRNLVQLIEEKLDVKVEWYRAARFGADKDTINILSELGLKYDSSFTPNIDWSSKGGPNHSKVQLDSYILDNKEIVEYPVTITGKRFGIIGRFLPDNWLFYKWLRPSHMTYMEQKSLIRYLKKNDIKNAVMMFHSMEVMVRKTPYVRNKFMQKYFLWRLEKTIKYAKQNGFFAD